MSPLLNNSFIYNFFFQYSNYAVIHIRVLCLDSNLTKKRRIRNRWLVAYTLLRNPSLRPLTAARLREQESTTEVVTEPGTEIKGIVELLIPGIN